MASAISSSVGVPSWRLTFCPLCVVMCGIYVPEKWGVINRIGYLLKPIYDFVFLLKLFRKKLDLNAVRAIGLVPIFLESVF